MTSSSSNGFILLLSLDFLLLYASSAFPNPTCYGENINVMASSGNFHWDANGVKLEWAVRNTSDISLASPFSRGFFSMDERLAVVVGSTRRLLVFKVSRMAGNCNDCKGALEFIH